MSKNATRILAPIDEVVWIDFRGKNVMGRKVME